MKNFNNHTYIYKIETYNDTCERIIKLPVSVFGRKGHKASIKRDKDDRIYVDNSSSSYSSNNSIKVSSKKIDIDDDKFASSVSRSKRNIRRICLSNEFEYFATWTINSEFCDRFTLQDVQKRMRYLLEEYKRDNPNFNYIYVFEKHKNGAIHLHGMVKGMTDLLKYNLSDFNKLPYYIIDTIEKRA